MGEVHAIRKEGQVSPIVGHELLDGILRLTLQNAPANALSIAMMQLLLEHLRSAREDKAVRVIIIDSSLKLFSAGHDLKELSSHRSDEDRGRAFFEQTMRLCAELMQAIVSHPKPVIAGVDGLATAAGCQLVASCDLAVCSDKSTFCTPGVNIGLFCSTPMVALSRNVSRKQAMEMLLTGETIDASTAREFGLVNRVVPQEYLNQIVRKYAQAIAAKSPLVLKIGKEAFYKQAEMDLASAYDYTAQVMVENMLARDAEEGIGAFMEKRKPEWTGE
ncbi:enoyl-CoA hydratase/carnithine racemase [Phyllobacterium ifriqiyense]|uniref:Enoyl-CoA hydratase domain-containing protein 3, mitochondrial n=1 Tax=Phyllobacterium ifriqiyense TaxID=314238 RepID=A0ABU0SDG6_9HYPH|nr:enoyl-CoA hydratase [Phyllobacterium ifriqiyense]MDQ0998799.1 enoyl-CoA hydratase/carnithine racemase [Phyllobacterium ifriqiyense]